MGIMCNRGRHSSLPQSISFYKCHTHMSGMMMPLYYTQFQDIPAYIDLCCFPFIRSQKFPIYQSYDLFRLFLQCNIFQPDFTGFHRIGKFVTIFVH